MGGEGLAWGTVKVVEGRHIGRIGCYDDDDDGRAIVYFGDPLLCSKYYLCPYKNLGAITTADLIERREEIRRIIGLPSTDYPPRRHRNLLLELNYVESQLVDRMFHARLGEKAGSAKVIFISHSSRDRQFATWLGVDIANVGHKPWLDEWEIRGGESIPRRISEGLEECDFVAVVLSEYAVKSKWVENEWHAKYWSEIEEGKLSVIPVLLKKCKVPVLLKSKKYVDFTHSYSSGFHELLIAIGGTHADRVPGADGGDG